jgi:hypothetical protein
MIRRFLFAAALALAMTNLVPIPAQAADLRFTSPSGNIDCVMGRESNEVFVDCLVENAKWPNAKPQPKDCDLDWDPYDIVLNVKGRGAAAKPSLYVGGCRGDIGALCVPGPDSDCDVLPFGEKRTVDSITCESTKAGMRCVTNRGRKLGFLISRNSWTRIS